jgi:chromate transporter
MPGATAVQLSIFLGYVRGGWWGGLLGGLCFALSGFALMLVLSVTYATFGVSPVLRGALYGLGPVVLGIFFVAVVRLGRNALKSRAQWAIAVGAALCVLFAPFGAVLTLLLAGAVGLFLLHSKRAGTVMLAVLIRRQQS